MLFILLCCQAQAQLVKGKIIDAHTKEALSFAVVIVDNTNKGTTADLDGNFEINLPEGATSVYVQTIGYEKKTVSVQEMLKEQPLVIKLNGTGIRLLEIVVTPKENPAIPIIRKVILNKTKYDIENLPRYICNTYAKTYFTFADRNGNETEVDTSTAGGRMFKNSYLFFMESVTEKKYRYKNIAQEKVMASRVSGFKSAPFGAFASQLQSFTFYRDNIDLMGLHYLNPLSKGTFKRYNFEIMDTVLAATDTTILIKFYPKKNAKFKAMKGVLYINKNQYALAKVLAEPSQIPSDGNGIKIQQLYERIDLDHWFPKQANTEIIFYGIATTTDKADSAKELSLIKGVSRLYIRDVNLDSVFKIKHKSIATYNEEGFDQKSEKFWQEKREDTLTKKELNTYVLIDSIGKEANLDKKLKWIKALSSGQFELGYISIDLKHIIRVNDYEGIRLGAGLLTSNRLSRVFSIGGYGGYGFGDKAFKYGGQLRLNFDERQSVYFLAEAAREVVESAGTSFLQENANFISTENIRNLLVAKMDKVSFGKASINFPVFGFIKTSAYMQVQMRQSPFGYAQAQDHVLLNEKKDFVFNEAGIQLKIWPGEKFTESMGQLVSLHSRWPVFFVNLAQGMTNNLLNYQGDFSYTKVDLRIDHQIMFKVKGFFSWQIQAGKVFGDVPYSIQYNNKSSRSDHYLVSAEKSFETMYMNEFISSQYAALFLAINSGKLIKPNAHFNPELELVHNFGIGTLDNRQHLTNIELNDISKGYTETGVRVKSLVRSSFSALGLGVYYRYGNYASDKTSKNFVYKAVLSYSF